LAAELCGYQIHFVDVEESTWAMDPDDLAAHPLLDRVGLILVAAPYGRRLAQTAWARLSQQTGIAVVIDAAASIEALADDSKSLVGAVPVVLSFHATKAFSTGEGGADRSRCSQGD
jgi:dTDP-4-amino-4,6-dideoxygalactose transaminase